jgi:hypothetical protein
MKPSSVDFSALKQAKKTFKFWYQVLLETELMNDPEHRKEYHTALKVLKTEIKKEKGS